MNSKSTSPGAVAAESTIFTPVKNWTCRDGVHSPGSAAFQGKAHEYVTVEEEACEQEAHELEGFVSLKKPKGA